VLLGGDPGTSPSLLTVPVEGETEGMLVGLIETENLTSWLLQLDREHRGLVVGAQGSSELRFDG